MLLNSRRISLVLSLLFIAAPMAAKANTLAGELGSVDKLRKAFGDEFVAGLTNLPPKNYFKARDQALAMAEQVSSGSLAVADAKKSLCASFEKNGGNGCPALAADTTNIADVLEPAQRSSSGRIAKDLPADLSGDLDAGAVSGVKKTSSGHVTNSADLAAVGEEQGTEAFMMEAPELAGEPVAPRADDAPKGKRALFGRHSPKLSKVEAAAPEEPELSPTEPELKPGKKSAISEPDLNPTDLDHVSVPQHHRASEPQLESDNPEDDASREVSSEPVILSPVVESPNS